MKIERQYVVALSLPVFKHPLRNKDENSSDDWLEKPLEKQTPFPCGNHLGCSGNICHAREHGNYERHELSDGGEHHQHFSGAYFNSPPWISG